MAVSSECLSMAVRETIDVSVKDQAMRPAFLLVSATAVVLLSEPSYASGAASEHSYFDACICWDGVRRLPPAPNDIASHFGRVWCKVCPRAPEFPAFLFRDMGMLLRLRR